MTLIVAIIAKDGLVVASDSQMTFATSGQPVRTPTAKLHSPWSNIVWGAAGNVGVIQRVEQELAKRHNSRKVFEKKAIADVRRDLTQAVVHTVREIVKDQYLPVQGLAGVEGTYFFAGWVPQGPFLIAVEPNLVEMDHVSVGYCAIGSGDVFAYAGLAHYNVGARSLHECKLIAYRVLQDAIRVAAFGLGDPIQMFEIAKPPPGESGQTGKIEQAELLALRDKVEEWKMAEAEVLTDLVGAPPPTASPDPQAVEASDIDETQPPAD